MLSRLAGLPEVSEIHLSVRLAAEQKLLRARFARRPGNLPFHLVRVVFEERNSIQVEMQVRRIEVLCLRLGGGGARLLQQVQMQVRVDQIGIAQAAVRIETE